MRRRRFLRILVPALLVPFVLLIVLTMRQRPVTRTQPGTADLPPGPRVEDFQLDDLLGASRRLSLRAVRGWQDAQGAWHLEGVERLVIDREDAPPIVIRAKSGGVTGGPGQRVFRLEGGVEIREEEQGMLVSLPTLEVDQPSGVARSVGEVKISAPNFEGTARSVVYGLEGQPTEIEELQLRTRTGATLRSPRVLLHRGTERADLTGGVEATRGPTSLTAGGARLFRGKDGKIEKAIAESGVVANDRTPNRPPSRMRSRTAEFEWDRNGDPSVAVLRGDAEVVQGESTITAATIHLHKEAGRETELTATESVSAKGLLREGAGELRSDRLIARLDPAGKLKRGTASGNVRFDSKDATGEAATAEFEAGPQKGSVVLVAGPDRRARLVRGATRVVADRITSFVDGSSLNADGNVEATLLPKAGSSQPSSPQGLFRPTAAVHFVAAHLEGESSGKRLKFRGAVRGWQGDRNLAADEVTIEQEPDSLTARGNVNTRMPRTPDKAAAVGDYIQVSASALAYEGEAGQGVYTGAVRARLSEGWVECARLEVDLRKETSAISEIRAFEDVRMEFRSTTAAGTAGPPMSGEGDRLLYDPRDETVLLLGDKRPAVVRRSGENGGTSTGRVLRYRLDLGTLEVESGERDRARIRPSTN